MAQIKEGSKAPAFELHDQDDKPFSSSDLEGKAYALWFYPKADTPG
jgi:peroxiredoxin Q/BCP